MHVLISLLIVIILLRIDHSYIKVGTLLCMIFGGPIIDGYTLLIKPVFVAFPSLEFKLAMLIAGCVILAFGMTVVIKSDAGTGPNDLVALVISDKSKKKFSIVRILVDCSFVALGFALGGVLGIGTVICAFLVGPVAGFFLPHSERIVAHFLSKL